MCPVVGGPQEVESVRGLSTSTQSPVWQTHRSPEDVFMTWLGVYFWYGTHEQLLRMENLLFSQKFLTNGDTLVCAILIYFNQYVFGGFLILCLIFIFAHTFLLHYSIL